MSMFSNMDLKRPSEKLELPKGIRRRSQLVVDAANSRTKQVFTAEADINLIVDRFMKTGQLPTMPPPVFGDISHVPRGTEALALIRRAHLAWASLPISLRAALGNDMSKLPAWLEDPVNRQEAAKMGLLRLADDLKADVAAAAAAANQPGVAKAATPPQEPAKPAEGEK